MRNIVLYVATVFLVACASNPRVEDLSPEQRAKIANIEVFKSPPSRIFVVLGKVDGLSCNRNNFQSPNISEAEAMQGVLLNAALLKADAVINTVCQTNSDTDWRNNCWASVKCVGDAIKYQQN